MDISTIIPKIKIEPIVLPQVNTEVQESPFDEDDNEEYNDVPTHKDISKYGIDSRELNELTNIINKHK